MKILSLVRTILAGLFLIPGCLLTSISSVIDPDLFASVYTELFKQVIDKSGSKLVSK